MNPRMFAVLLAAALVAGCERAQQTDAPPPIQATEAEYLVAVVPDLSGSFVAMMNTDDGKAYRFFMAVIDRYFRDRLGSNDQLIIAQISAAQKSLLWDGQPKQLRSHFKNASAFNQFLLKNSNPAGSRVFQGIADTIEYVLDCPGVAEGKVKSAVLVLSDMDDNAPDGPQQKARLQKLLTAYAKTGGVIGLYWVESDVIGWRRTLKDAGFKNFVVESSIKAEPELPKFGD